MLQCVTVDSPVSAAPAAGQPEPGEADAAPGQARPLPWPVAVGLAVLAGGALLVAFAPYDLWWAAPVAVAALAVAVHRRRIRAGAGLGLLTGLIFFVPLLSWTNLHTGSLPWLLLSASQAVYVALLGAAAAYASPLVDRWPATWPAVTGLLWVAQEALRDRTPFGGFPWGRVAFSQGDSPLLRLAVLGGAPLVTLGVAVAGGLLAAAVWRSWRRPSRAVALRGAGLAAAAIALVAAAALIPAHRPGGPPVTVAIVQGNVPRLGLDFNAQRRAVLDNHVNATIALAGQVAAGAVAHPDLVVWPENSSDIDPLRNVDAAARIDEAAAAIEAPILVGAVLRGPGPNQVRNAGLLWRPVDGPDNDQMYVKRHPVPFAEYIPMRAIARTVSKEVDRVRSDFVAGNSPGVVATGPVTVGDVICFEVAYDGIVRDTVVGGADVLVVQTNNATFDVAEARQQLAMVRLRAVEHGRESLMSSTVGISGFVRADGTVVDATGFNARAVVVREMHPGVTRTLATTLGHWPEVVLVVLALGALVGAALLRWRRPGPAVRSERVAKEGEARA
jgi:apolipoprotein N-acyltransferase